MIYLKYMYLNKKSLTSTTVFGEHKVLKENGLLKFLILCIRDKTAAVDISLFYLFLTKK